METFEKALPAGGPAKPAQNSKISYETTRRDRLILALCGVWCLLAVDGVLWAWPLGGGLTATVFGWYLLLLAALGKPTTRPKETWALLPAILALACSFALHSNRMLQAWNFLVVLGLLGIHTAAWSSATLLAWWRPAMLFQRLRLLLRGMFLRLGAACSALSPPCKSEKARTLGPLLLGLGGAGLLLVFLVPILVSADALFAAATASLGAWLGRYFTLSLWKLTLALAATPFVFGLLYELSRPAAPKAEPSARRKADALVFVVILGALDALYVLFLAVQSAGLFGGAAYLAQRGITYAEWARSGFFQMVGVSVVNLSVTMAALTFASRNGQSWKALRGLSAFLLLESLVLLGSAAWRMTLYISAYGLSFKRCMTYWGMAMTALFLLAALWKTHRPDASFFRAAFPLAVAGWLVINCVPVDHLVAKNQVDRYLSGVSASIDLEYLLFDLSYDTLPQLERLDGTLILRDPGPGYQRRLSALLQERREQAAKDCSHWRSWNLSACLAAGG